jgi:hypothetical protein
MRIAVLLLSLVLLSACTTTVPLSSALDGGVTNGTKVRIKGFVSLEFEGQSIYETAAACTSSDTARALWVDVPRGELPESWRDCAYGEISGEFRPGDTGHFGMWPRGGIDSVWRIKALKR